MAKSSFFNGTGVTSNYVTDLEAITEETSELRDAAAVSAAESAASANSVSEDANIASSNASASQASAASAANSLSDVASSAAIAQASQAAAALSETASATSATNAANSAAASSTSANSAATSETNAAASANSASGFTTSAQAAQVAAETAQVAAETAQTNTETAETNAATSAADAATSATAAATDGAGQVTLATTQVGLATTQANLAQAAKLSAETSETNAAASASTATAQAALATTNGSTQVSLATAQASAAATSASNSATSENNAAASQVAASASQVASAASQVAAANSAAAAAAAFDNFDDSYLGSKTSDPTVDNDGDPLTTGDLYFNSTANEMRVYDGANWIAASSAISASLINYNYTATASQTTFSGADDNTLTLSYTQDNLLVTLNGILLEGGTDYTATDGTSIVLASGASVDDELNIVAFKSFTVADTYTKSEADSRYIATGTPTGGGLFKGENGEVGSSAGDIFRINQQTLNTSTTIDADENANATGPLAVASGVTLTVTAGGSLSIV